MSSNEENAATPQQYRPRPPSPRASYRLLDTLDWRLSESERTDFTTRLRDALEHFPELSGETVTVGRLKPSTEYVRGDPAAVADPYNRMIYVPFDDRTRNTTIYHELAHLAVRARIEDGDDHLPHTSEEFTSIYAIAKMRPEDIDSDRISYLGEPALSRDDWPGVCQRALEYRQDNRDYIKQCKEWLGI